MRRDGLGWWVLVGAVCSWCTAACGQGTIPALPKSWQECEGGGACGTWTFNGSRGSGHWPYGADAILIVERNDAGGVRIRRNDPSGSSPGLTAVYTGTIQGNEMSGSVTWTWQGHRSAPWSGTWHATIAEPVAASPKPPAPPQGGSHWIDQWIDQAKPVADPAGFACRQPVAGEPGMSAFDQWRKGMELDRQERDLKLYTNRGQVPAALPWFCKASAAGSANAAYEIGRTFNDGWVVNVYGANGGVTTFTYSANKSVAFYWYGVAAGRGNTQAMYQMAQYYFVGPKMKESGIEIDTAKGLMWLRKAAEGGETDAQLWLAQAYAPGLHQLDIATVNKDRTAALSWLAKAAATAASHQPMCLRPDAVEQMHRQLPQGDEERATKSIVVVAVHGSADVECRLLLTDPPKNRSNAESVIASLSGGDADGWTFTVAANPATGRTTVYAQTRGDALEQVGDLAAMVTALNQRLNGVGK